MGLWHFRAIASKDTKPYFFYVSNWNANPMFLAILAGTLVVIALILVLPQVDLLDTAFHRGNSPIAARARLTSAPLLAVVTPVARADGGISFDRNDRALPPVPGAADVASSLLCSFRC
jgi:hypothetical protein